MFSSRTLMAEVAAEHSSGDPLFRFQAVIGHTRGYNASRNIGTAYEQVSFERRQLLHDPQILQLAPCPKNNGACLLQLLKHFGKKADS